MSNTRRLTRIIVLGAMLWLIPLGLLARTPLLVLEEASHLWRDAPEPPFKQFWLGNTSLPTFVLYDDGLVLFRTERNSTELRSSQLTRAAVEEWIGLIEQSGFSDLQTFYSLNRMLDQPISVIKYRCNGDIKEDCSERPNAKKH